MSEKKRTLAQRIGEAGESIVKLWATDNQLSASKIDYDFGFDFSIQHFSKNGKHEFASGIFFLAQCKATEDENKLYVKLDKGDAYLYLSTSIPSCIFSVDNILRKVKFRFIDTDLTNKLLTFVESNNDSINLRIDSEFYDESVLQSHISKNANSTQVQELKVHIVTRLLNKYSPGVDVRAISSGNKSILNLKPIWITSIVSPESIFSNRNLGEFIDLNIIEILNKYLPSFNTISISGKLGTQSKISSGKGSISTLAISYPNQKNISYRLKSGLAVTAGPCVKKGSNHFHELSFEVKQSDFPLVQCTEDCRAISDIVANRKLSINDHALITNLKKWKELESFLFSCSQIQKAHASGKFDFSQVYACDLNDYNTFYTIDIVTKIINRLDQELLFPGFVLEDVDSKNGVEREMKNGIVPIAFSLKTHKYVVMLTAEFYWIKNKSTGIIIGFEIHNVIQFEINKLDWEAREIPIPEIWLTESWPAIPMKDSISINFSSEKRPYTIVEETQL